MYFMSDDRVENVTDKVMESAFGSMTFLFVN